MIKEFPKDRAAKRKMLLDAVEGIATALRASGPHSEEQGTLAPEAVKALRDTGMFRLKLCAEMGGAEADPVTEMLVLEESRLSRLDQRLVHHGRRHCDRVAWHVSATDRVAQVFKNGTIPTASISFFPAGRAVRKGEGYRVNGRWRFNSGIRHAEWVLGGTVVEGTEAENGGKPIVMFSAFPAADVTLHDNWGGVVGLRGTGSCDFSVENYELPPELTFVWDLLHRSRCAAVPPICFRRSAMSPRSMAASRSAPRGAHSTN